MRITKWSSKQLTVIYHFITHHSDSFYTFGKYSAIPITLGARTNYPNLTKSGKTIPFIWTSNDMEGTFEKKMDEIRMLIENNTTGRHLACSLDCKPGRCSPSELLLTSPTQHCRTQDRDESGARQLLELPPVHGEHLLAGRGRLHPLRHCH